MPVELQVLSIFAVSSGFVDSLEVAQIKAFEEGLHQYMLTTQSEVMDELRAKKELTSDITEKLKTCIKSFSQQFGAGVAAAKTGSAAASAKAGAKQATTTHANAA
jgi:F-type H+-transporting ATPase subunit alpha